MKKRSKGGGERTKGRRPKMPKPTRRNALKVEIRSKPSSVAEEKEVARFARERDEALEQQAATSEVLNVISRSTFDLPTALNTLVETAARLCRADKVQILLPSENTNRVYLAASFGYSAEYNEFIKMITFAPGREGVAGRVLVERKPVQIADVLADPEYRLREFQRLGGFRTHLGLPLLRKDSVIGVLLVSRAIVEPFDDKHIKLLSTFAAQAVIAIENARLLNELRQSLERQTATSEVLQVISTSSSDLVPVFATMLEKAVSICDAKFGTLYLREKDRLRLIATHDVPPAFAETQGHEPFLPAPHGMLDAVMRTARTVHLADLATARSYIERDPRMVNAVEVGGIRTVVGVPLLKDNELIGLIGIYRQEVRPFAEKQIALLTNFAAQAVIAIENARLLNELRQRTADLTEALEQQTATSEVLQVISNSPGDLEPVFETMLENAVRICDAKFGNIYHWDDDQLHLIAMHNTPPAFAEARRRSPHRRVDMNRAATRMLETKAPVQVIDAAAQPGYLDRSDLAVVEAVELGGVRTLLGVPMLKENELIGAFTLYRQEVRPFTEKQIALVTNFAAQAVIAIENARLLNELRQRTTDVSEALEQQTATAEVLGVISRSPGDLQPVFQTMLESAVRVCDAKFGSIYRWDGDVLRLVATDRTSPAFAEERRRLPPRFGPNDPVGRMVRTKAVVHVDDVAKEQEYLERANPAIVGAVELAGVRTFLTVPMLKENDLIGSFSLYRQEVRPFTDKQIELVKNFAAQAVIAIENARLLKELRERTEEVEKLNQHLEQRVADQVGEIERMSRLRRFLPPQVADLIVASGSEKQLESHRREITALFCDLRGFTGFTESADAEDVMALLRDYHAAIGEIIVKYNGTLERYAGDGVMVVFNDPVPVENPALQAVLMALEVREAIGALTETWRRLGHEIGFGIGIAHGFATLGTIGFEGRFDYAAIGTVSNVASRLCDEAKPGQILISPRVLTKVETAVKVEPVGEFELKGIRRPLAAYNVVGVVTSTV